LGFHKDTYAKVWSVERKSDTMTKLKLSISKKNKDTNQYETDFSDFVICVGTACASKAAKLKKGDRIKIGDCDVTNQYNKDKNVTYYNFKIFNFETADGGTAKTSKPEVDDGEADSRLPF